METRIYVLDDEPDVCSIIEQSLSVLVRNAVVRTFTTPEEMLQDDDLEKVDLFIIDISLQRTRKNGSNGAYDGRYIPDELPEKCKLASYLFVSGIVTSLDFTFLPSGIVYDYMPKPWNIYIFQNRVRNLLRLNNERKEFFERIGVDETRAYFRKQIQDDRAAIRLLRSMSTAEACRTLFGNQNEKEKDP